MKSKALYSHKPQHVSEAVFTWQLLERFTSPTSHICCSTPSLVFRDPIFISDWFQVGVIQCFLFSFCCGFVCVAGHWAFGTKSNVLPSLGCPQTTELKLKIASLWVKGKKYENPCMCSRWWSFVSRLGPVCFWDGFSRWRIFNLNDYKFMSGFKPWSKQGQWAHIHVGCTNTDVFIFFFSFLENFISQM